MTCFNSILLAQTADIAIIILSKLKTNTYQVWKKKDGKEIQTALEFNGLMTRSAGFSEKLKELIISVPD